MKVLLEEIQNFKMAPEDWNHWAVDKANLFGKSWVPTESARIYRAFQDLTVGQAIKVVESESSGDGYGAWFNLHRHFEHSLATEQGEAYASLGDMTRMTAKATVQTKEMVTEI